MLIIVGEGDQREYLESLALKLGIDRNVVFLGFREDISIILAGIDLFISTSYREGLSISIIEAMAAAKPIIAANIPANRELIDDGETGLLISPKMPELFAQGIDDVVNKPVKARNMGLRARDVAISQFSIERVLSQTWELYLKFYNE